MISQLKKLLLLIQINLLKTDCNAKINEIKGKIPSVSDLVKKTNYNAKINEIKC